MLFRSDVIVRTGHAKERLLNPHVIISQRFKYDTVRSNMKFINLLPRGCTILSLHAIGGSKLPGKPSRCTLCHEMSCICWICCSWISRSKYLHHRCIKHVHGFNACRLRHTKVVISTVYAAAPCARYCIAASHF